MKLNEFDLNRNAEQKWREHLADSAAEDARILAQHNRPEVEKREGFHLADLAVALIFTIVVGLLFSGVWK